MALVGDYDASTFVEGNYATYPQLPPGVTYYQPSMHWRVSVPGVVHGQPVVVNDLLFATQGFGRLYGQNLYGDQIYGGLSEMDWTVDQVFFLKWDSTQAPPDTLPYPNAGCPFTQDWTVNGNWAPRWRIVIDAHYNNLEGTRTYGDGVYGDDVYGDPINSGEPYWVDLTQPSFSVVCGDGTREGEQRVVVSEVVIQLVDDNGSWLDFAEPAIWYQPQPGTPLRVGFIDPLYRYHPVITGQLERIEDVHETLPRLIALRGFGNLMDLVVDYPGHQRPAETAAQRFNWLSGLAGWRWDAGSVIFPGDAALHADADPYDIVVRDEMDRTVMSAGWYLDTDRKGRMRVREWPHVPAEPAVPVVDCSPVIAWDRVLESGPARRSEAGEPRALESQATVDTERISHSITFVNDEGELLNYVVTTNATDPESRVQLEDPFSVARFGRRGRALGFPKQGLAWANTADAERWARRVLNRFANITRHVERFDVDTVVDEDWLEVLADLETGRAVKVSRRVFAPFSLDCVVVGWHHEIVPGQWRAEIYTQTLTPTL